MSYKQHLVSPVRHAVEDLGKASCKAYYQPKYILVDKTDCLPSRGMITRNIFYLYEIDTVIVPSYFEYFY